MFKIAINGFGRIGRLALRAALDSKEMEFAAINDITDNKTLAHLLKYDTVHGTLDRKIEVKENSIVVDGKEIKTFSERDPKDLPWKEMGIDLVIESTGVFRTREAANMHIIAGAKKVLISAPAKDEIDATIVMGVNDEVLKPEHKIVSNASCTTNCLAPLMKLINDKLGINSAYMTTVHAYTNGQSIIDSPHKDLRRARTAAANMIPTTTGAAKATEKVIPALQGKLDAMAVRVPTPNGSLIDVSVILDKEVTADEFNALIKEASENELSNVLDYLDEEVVSSDIVGNPHSSIFDSLLTKSHGNFVKFISWYDNEWGYANRTVDLALKMLKM